MYMNIYLMPIADESFFRLQSGAFNIHWHFPTFPQSDLIWSQSKPIKCVDAHKRQGSRKDHLCRGAIMLH